VAILMILRPNDSRLERYVILTGQSRIGAASTLPVGMFDERSGDVKGKAIDEIYKETNLQIMGKELVDLTKLARKNPEASEDIPILLWEQDLDRKKIESLKGKLAPNGTQNELVSLRVDNYHVLSREGVRDARTLAAWALYEGLIQAGRIG
jgi:ADP-sugar diphosphatase